ncbi:MAG: hypothetical protein ACXVEY_13810, partial [Actinomycetota bacterium]
MAFGWVVCRECAVRIAQGDGSRPRHPPALPEHRKGAKFTPVGVHLENLGLKESGFAEGQNAAVEYRSTEGQFDRFPALASELLRRNVAVLVVTSSAGARAAKQATSTLPIVFSVGDD